jgi:hypothetical protein
MNKGSTIAVVIFGVCFLALFLLGTMGASLTIKHYLEVQKIVKSSEVDIAFITRIIKGVRTSNKTVYFKLQNDEKEYKINLIKILTKKIKIGDEIHIKFNDNKTVWIICEHLSAINIGYIIQIILFCICFLVSIVLFVGIISIIRHR